MPTPLPPEINKRFITQNTHSLQDLFSPSQNAKQQDTKETVKFQKHSKLKYQNKTKKRNKIKLVRAQFSSREVFARCLHLLLSQW